MSNSAAELMACPGCGASLTRIEGPVHRYMDGSPACWAQYGQALAREYENPSLFDRCHRLTVDAYAVQHPGAPSPQTNQSIAVHLIGLYLVLESGMDQHVVTAYLKRATELAPYERLSTPTRFPVTVASMQAVDSPEQHISAVDQWAKAAWLAWADHHETVAGWAQRCV